MIVKWMNKKLQWSQRLTMFDITMQWFPTHAATVSFLPEPWIRQSISARRSEASSFEAQKENNWSPCSNGCATLSPVPNGFDAMASTLPPLGSLSQTSVDEDSSRSWSDFGHRGWDPKWSNHTPKNSFSSLCGCASELLVVVVEGLLLWLCCFNQLIRSRVLARSLRVADSSCNL